MPTPDQNDLSTWIDAELHDARAMIDACRADADALRRLDAFARHLAEVFRAGGKVLACGNGGSACDAMHFCEELTGRYRFNRPALPAIACADASHITCAANDFGYDAAFARWVEALARPGDALVVLSTSGNSRNILAAVEAAETRGVTTAAFLGQGGGALRGRCDYQWVVPAPQAPDGSERKTFSDRIQEVHMLLLHVLVGAIERHRFGPDGAERDAESE
ncbi:MAG: SIS domain-containing protein [Phycisphaerales bacterium]|nr:MAG: SIS domain-containing protein [Phycisphaerales bacterium]